MEKKRFGLDASTLRILALVLTLAQRLDPKYEAWLNAAGFVLLLALMVFVTFSDVLKLFH